MVTLILFLSVMFYSCATPDVDEGEVNRLRPVVNKNANVNVDPNANVAEDNELKLNSLINLPFEPEENDYREDVIGIQDGRVPSPTGRKLTAVLKFSTEDTKSLIDQLKEKGTPFETKADSETWFPAELVAKSQTAGDERLKGTGYSAKGFYKPPYSRGSVTHIDDTEYFVLILQTK